MKILDININMNECTVCGECVDVCPMNILQITDDKLVIGDISECSYCETCTDVCPEECITINAEY